MHDSVFYCVANMPGAVPHTSTYALTNATLPYVVALADLRLAATRCARPRARAGPVDAPRARSQPAGAAHDLEVTDVAAVLS